MINPKINLVSGDIIDDYRITRPCIAVGGTSTISEAVDSNGNRVALKMLNRSNIIAHFEKKISNNKLSIDEIQAKALLNYEKIVKRFKEEYKILVGLDHPNVARAYGMGFYRDHFYLTSEFVDGQIIGNYCHRIPRHEMMPLFIQLLEGLDFIHRNGLIHLDIKSENVIVQVLDNKPIVKIIDFGTALSPSDYGGEVFGSIPYIAPEIILGQREKVDCRSDLFSAAVLIYYCLSRGVFPFQRSRGGNIDVLKKIVEEEILIYPLSKLYKSEKVPLFIDTVITRLLSKEPDNRFYSNARSVINAFATKIPDVFHDMPDTRASYLMPLKNKHIGQKEEQELLKNSLDDLLKGKSPPIYIIEGTRGTGKTHLLKTIKDMAATHAEKLSILEIFLPAEDIQIEQLTTALAASIADNLRPLLVLIDNIDESKNTQIEGLFRLISERQKAPKLFQDAKPIMCVCSCETLPEFILSMEMHKINLKAFSLEEVAAYLLSTPAFREKEPPSQFIDNLYRRTSGVPAELAAHLRELDSKGLLFSLDGEIFVAPAEGVVQEVTISHAPADTRDRLLSQYQSLTPLEKKTADIIACWYWQFSPRKILMHDLLALDCELQVINQLVQKNILVHDKNAYEFFNTSYLPGLIHKFLLSEDEERIHDEIVSYLGSQDSRTELENDAIMFHRGFGSDKVCGYRNLLNLGKKYLLKGRTNFAIDIFKEALTTKPLPYLYSLITEALCHEGKYEEAIKYFNSGMEEATKIEGRGRLWRVGLSIKVVPAFSALKKFDEAHEIIDNAISHLDPKHKSILAITLKNTKARIYFDQRLKLLSAIEEAEKLYRESEEEENFLPADKKHLVSNNDLGAVLFFNGKYEDAIKKLEEKIKRIEYTRDIIKLLTVEIYLSDIYRLLEKYDEAVIHGKKALKLSNGLHQGKYQLSSHEILANIYHDQDKFDLAIAEYNNCFVISSCIESPDEYKDHSIRYKIHLGHCYKELKILERSLLYYESVLDNRPTQFFEMFAYAGIGEVFIEKGLLEEAVKQLNDAEILANNCPNELVKPYLFRIALLKARIYLDQGRGDKAAAQHNKMKSLAGDDKNFLKECDIIDNGLKTLHF